MASLLGSCLFSPVTVWILVIYTSTEIEAEVKLLTYNAGLTTKIPYMYDRSKHVVKNIASTNADVICLQEFWHIKDVREVVKANRNTHPYTFSAIHKDTEGILNTGSLHWPPCAQFPILSLFFKIWWYGCMKLTGEVEQFNCVHKKAGLMDLSQDCITCAAMTGMNAKKVLRQCVGSLSTKMNVPGLVILSKRNLTKTKMVYFIPGVKQILPRGYLHVRVEGLGTVACTHTTPNLGPVYYEPNLQKRFRSWEDQNLHDTVFLLNSMASYPNAVIMGDLNSSPSLPDKDIAADFEGSLRALKRNNYTMPYSMLVGKCTFCSENNLVPYKFNWILDHICIRGFHSKSAKRVMDEESLTVAGNLDTHFSPSDHYGIQVTIEIEN